MNIRTVRISRPLVLAASLFTLAACSTTSPAPSEKSAQTFSDTFEGGTFVFRLEDGTLVPGVPAKCGPSIPVKQVATLDVGPGSEPLGAVQDRYPDAQLARNNFVVTDITGTPAKTKRELVNYFAGLGCNLAVFGDLQTSTSTAVRGVGSSTYSGTTGLRVLWGIQGDTDSEVLIKNGFD